jgi:hypothetical protein
LQAIATAKSLFFTSYFYFMEVLFMQTHLTAFTKTHKVNGYVGFMAGLRCFLGKRLLWQEMSGIVRLNKQDALIDCQALLKNKEVLK